MITNEERIQIQVQIQELDRQLGSLQKLQSGIREFKRIMEQERVAALSYLQQIVSEGRIHAVDSYITNMETLLRGREYDAVSAGLDTAACLAGSVIIRIQEKQMRLKWQTEN